MGVVFWLILKSLCLGIQFGVSWFALCVVLDLWSCGLVVAILCWLRLCWVAPLLLLFWGLVLRLAVGLLVVGFAGDFWGRLTLFCF